MLSLNIDHCSICDLFLSIVFMSLTNTFAYKLISSFSFNCLCKSAFFEFPDLLSLFSFHLLIQLCHIHILFDLQLNIFSEDMIFVNPPFLFKGRNEVEPFLPFIFINIVPLLSLCHYLPKSAVMLVLHYHFPYPSLQELSLDTH